MKPHLFIVGLMVSLAPFCLILGLWLRSDRTLDLWSGGKTGYQHFTWDAGNGPHQPPSYPPPVPAGTAGWLLSGDGRIAFREQLFVAGRRVHPEQGYSWSTRDGMFPSFEYTYFEPNDQLGRGWFRYRQVSLCYWSLTICFSILPLLFLLHARDCHRAPQTALQQTTGADAVSR